MLTVEEIRHRKLLMLIEEHTVHGLAKLIGRTYSQVSQWKNRTPRGAKQRESAIDSDSCRRLESLLRLERGWMDNVASTAMAADVLAWFEAASPADQQRIFAINYNCSVGRWPGEILSAPSPASTEETLPERSPSKKASHSRP